MSHKKKFNITGFFIAVIVLTLIQWAFWSFVPDKPDSERTDFIGTKYEKYYKDANK
jgi:hypothetical protein